MITREESLELLHNYIKTPTIYKHSLAVEAILKHIALRLGEDLELWSQVGLLHDLDYDYTRDHPEQHAKMTAELIEGLVPDECIHAILAHNYQHNNAFPESALDKALIAGDAVSGLIIAAALIIPSKQLRDLSLSSLLKRYNEPSFARGCNRKRISLCEDLDIPLDDFLLLSLKALQEIHDELGV